MTSPPVGMKPKLNRFVLLLAIAVSGVSTMAQVANGDFSNGTNGWSYYLPPSNHFPPSYGIWNIDIDGPGPLGTSQAFYADVGSDALINLQQTVTLRAGVTYNLHADLESIPYSFNADGGTIQVFVDAARLASYSFGANNVIAPRYASISTNYTATASGPQTFSINFSRGYGYGGVGNTPADVIDNISLTPVVIPLQIQRNGAAVTLTWTNAAYVLQSAPAVSGPYTNIGGAGSPYTTPASATAQFFRVVGN
jgi:hypothetical protein